MKKRLVALVVAALAATVFTVVFTGGGGAQTATTITVRERGGAFEFVNNPPIGPHVSMGDELIIRSGLYSGGDRVGTLHANCTATKRGRGFGRATWHCNGDYVLFGRGNLSLDVVFRGRQTRRTIRIAVTGGTREFFGRDGAAAATAVGDSDATVHRIRLEP